MIFFNSFTHHKHFAMKITQIILVQQHKDSISKMNVNDTMYTIFGNVNKDEVVPVFWDVAK